MALKGLCLRAEDLPLPEAAAADGVAVAPRPGGPVVAPFALARGLLHRAHRKAVLELNPGVGLLEQELGERKNAARF